MNEKTIWGKRGFVLIGLICGILMVFSSIPSCKSVNRPEESTFPDETLKKYLASGDLSDIELGETGQWEGETAPDIHALPSLEMPSPAAVVWEAPAPPSFRTYDGDETIIALKEELASSVEIVEDMKNRLRKNEQLTRAEIASGEDSVKQKEVVIVQLQEKLSALDTEKMATLEKVQVLENEVTQLEREKEEVRTVLSEKEQRLHEENMELSKEVDHLQDTLRRRAEEWQRKLELVKVELNQEHESVLISEERVRSELVHSFALEKEELVKTFEREREEFLFEFEHERNALRSLLKEKEREFAAVKSGLEKMKRLLREKEEDLLELKEKLRREETQPPEMPPERAPAEDKVLQTLEDTIKKMESRIGILFQENLFFKKEIQTLKKEIQKRTPPSQKCEEGKEKCVPLRNEEKKLKLLAA